MEREELSKTFQCEQVELVWTPDFLRVKLIHLGLGKAIQRSISKNDKTEKENKILNHMTFPSGFQKLLLSQRNCSVLSEFVLRLCMVVWV